MIYGRSVLKHSIIYIYQTYTRAKTVTQQEKKKSSHVGQSCAKLMKFIIHQIQIISADYNVVSLAFRHRFVCYAIKVFGRNILRCRGESVEAR